MFETTKGSPTMRKDEEQYQMKYEEVEPISFKQMSFQKELLAFRVPGFHS